MKSKKKILIIGGTGFIGYHLAKACLKKNWIITSVSLKKPEKNRFLKKVKYKFFDISIYNNIRKNLIDRYDYVVNLGGHVIHKNSKKVLQSHFIGCKNLANFFEKKNIKFFIQVGSSAENGRILSPQIETLRGKPKGMYGIAKLKASKYLLLNKKIKKLPFVILRLYQVYGPNQDLNRFIPIVIKSCKLNIKFNCSDGKQFRDFLYIDDLIKVFFKCFKFSNKINRKILNIGFGKSIQLIKIINYIMLVTQGGKPDYGKIKLREDESKNTYPTIKLAKKYLNWKPKISVFEGIKKIL